VKTGTFRRKLEALRGQAAEEQITARRQDNLPISWAWWAIVDTLDAAMSALNVIEELSEG